MKKILCSLVFGVIVSLTGTTFAAGDLLIPGYTVKQALTGQFSPEYDNFTVIPRGDTKQWDADISQILNALVQNLDATTTEKIQLILKYVANKPYIYQGTAEGESDWGGATPVAHVKQDPVFRTDVYDCQTLVQTIMALLVSTDLQSFKHNIVTIEYGGGGAGRAVHYYNRNNFISKDFNPVNEANGYLQDATPNKNFVSALITKDKWFSFQARDLKGAVHVFDPKDGAAMARRFANYATLHPFTPAQTRLSYIAKTNLVHCVIKDGKHTDCQPNQAAIANLATPSVVEIVRDANKWLINGKPIADLIGSQLNVSHVGLLYDEHFVSGQIEYQRIVCNNVSGSPETCQVEPVRCTQASGCNEKMFLAATDAYPFKYYYYSTSSGYQCTAKAPEHVANPVYCNRVMSMPIGDYLASQHNHAYIYMDSASIVGIHLEKIKRG